MAAALTMASALCQSPVTDGFESPVLAAHWATTQQSGSVATSTAQPHTGIRSAELSTTNSSQNKYVALALTLPTPQYGRVSVWVKDTAATLSSSNYISFTARNTISGAFTDILTFDYNLGPGLGGDVYYYRPWNTSSQPIPSTISRTNTWHLWEIDSLPGSFAVRVNGQTLVASSQSMPIDSVILSLSGPNWRPPHTTYFDDFSFVATVGTGCAQGTPPVLVAGIPVLGSALQFGLQSARPNAPILFAVAPGGPTTTQVGSCDVQVALVAASLSLVGSTTASGAWSHSIAIPQNPSLVGFELTAQSMVIGNGGPMLGIGDLSTAATLMIAF